MSILTDQYQTRHMDTTMQTPVTKKNFALKSHIKRHKAIKSDKRKARLFAIAIQIQYPSHGCNTLIPNSTPQAYFWSPAPR